MSFLGYRVEILKLKKSVEKTPFNKKSDYEEMFSFIHDLEYSEKKVAFEDAQAVLDKVSELSKVDEKFKDFDYFGGLGRLLDVYLQDDYSAEFTNYEVRRYDYMIIFCPIRA